MSWFTTNDVVGVEDASPAVEIADGVVLERRRVLMASATVTGALLLGGATRLRAEPGCSGTPLTLQQLLEQALPMAREIVARSSGNEQAYMFQLASLIARLDDRAAPPGKVMRDFRKNHQKEGEARFPIVAVQLRLKPGGRISYHDHRDYNGVILGVEGTVRTRNYDIVGKNLVPPEGKTFQIMETQDTLVTPGQYSMLSRRRNNIHDLRAGPEGARVLDVFTFFDRQSRSYWMDVDDKRPRDAEARIYDAAWRPRRRRRPRRKD